jgi:uncharacterized protein YkwD
VDILERVEKNPAHAALARLAGRREELDRRRASALAVIRDTVKYPYPHLREKGADSAAIQNYREHQPIVTERTRLVEDVWNDLTEVRIGTDFLKLVDRLREVDAWMVEAGFDVPRDDASWYGHLPAKGPVTIRNFAFTAADRARLDASEDVMASNARMVEAVSKPEQDQARITNEYRLLFGEWAVTVSDKLSVASRGHCNDMARLGFFSHTSKVRGKESPSQRAALAGAKPIGLGENIARNGSAMGAHNGWILSPGHHRNILSSGWRIMGIGQSGTHWCQMFSGGDAGDER